MIFFAAVISRGEVDARRGVGCRGVEGNEGLKRDGTFSCL